MITHWTTSLTRLTNEALLVRVHDLARRERRATVGLIAHLAELDERRLYLDEGCSSLFTYCTEVLHFSEHAAYNRIECARAARRFPLVLDRLAEGSVHLTAVRLLSPHLTPANHAGLLDRARHLGKRGVEELIAAIRPLPDAATMVRRLSARRPASNSPVAAIPVPAATLPSHQSDDPTPLKVRLPEADLTAAKSNLAAVIAPLRPGHFRVQFTADPSMHHDLMTAHELLRHQIPDGDAAAVLKMALKLLVGELRRKKFATTDRPRRSAPSDPNSRHIPAAVRREVARRDGDRCAFHGRDGRRCSARGPLEFHHLEPFAVGGRATVDNISLRCRAHNSHEAVRCFGRFQLVPERVVFSANPELCSGEG
ncbi:MAG: hypothetical protein SGI90_12830 [Candidatus Eisenbacteria bacterium]|nr:hypothetical protein [Candidatus Eisenbacteria bacterium]